jgi:hypothetical protein
MVGNADQGTYCHLEKRYEHVLERTAANFCHGPFGGVIGTKPKNVSNT